MVILNFKHVCYWSMERESMINQHRHLVVSNLTKACVVVTGDSMLNIDGVLTFSSQAYIPKVAIKRLL